MRRLKGLVIATITPMREDGSVDWAGLEAHIKDLIDGGAEGLFAAGTTGEGLLLEEEERVEVVAATVRAAAGRVPVVGLCGGLTTAQAIRLARRMRQAGAEGVAALTPFYYRVDAAAMVAHFRAIADTAGCPLYLYSIPGLTGVALPVEVLAALKDHPRFGGLKFSHCDLEQLRRYLKTGAPVLIGCDSLITEAVRAGAAGTVSGTAAGMPTPYAQIFKALRAGEDAGKAQQLGTRLDAIMAGLPPIAGYKAALKRRGVITSDAVRSPLRRLTREEAARLDAALKEVGL
jgi:4-hydroxy-tetrahydrodipicolinate synthase